MIHSAAAIQIPQIIISDDREIDFIYPLVKISAESEEEEESDAYYEDEEIDDRSSTTTIPMRRYLRPDNIRWSHICDSKYRRHAYY